MAVAVPDVFDHKPWPMSKIPMKPGEEADLIEILWGSFCDRAEVGGNCEYSQVRQKVVRVSF